MQKMPKKITGALLPLLLIFILAISEVETINVYAGFIAESLSKSEKISIAAIVLVNAFIAARVLCYLLDTKDFLGAFNIIAASLTPLIAYNLIVVLYRENLSITYVPLDPLGIFSLIFTNDLTKSFLLLHLLVWAPVFLIYWLMLKKYIPDISSRKIILSALVVTAFYIIVAIPISYLIAKLVYLTA